MKHLMGVRCDALVLVLVNLTERKFLKVKTGSSSFFFFFFFMVATTSVVGTDKTIKTIGA